MEDLKIQCKNAQSFPLNLCDVPTCMSEAFRSKPLHKTLSQNQGRLCCATEKALINILEYGFGKEDWWPKSFTNADGLRDHLGLSCAESKRDPWSRFMIWARSFIDAPNSRAALKVTRTMLTLLLSYHQIQPDFIDFLMPFGKQSNPQDFHFTSFRQRTRLSTRHRGLAIPELGWSGRDFQMCYNLKSVEILEDSEDNPFSIRHCAISHTFDVEKARTSWIVIKGNALIQQRITHASSIRGLTELREIDSLEGAFAASLVVHTILCDWAAEGWRWYINFLEEKIKPIERRAMNYEIDGTMVHRKNTSEFVSEPRRAQTDITEKSHMSRLSRTTRRLTSAMSSIQENRIFNFSRRNTSRTHDLEMQPQNLSFTADELADDGTDQYGQQKFSFRELQDLHYIDSRRNEADLVIQHDLSVLQQIVTFYDYLIRLRDFPPEISSRCAEELSHFRMHVSGIEMELKMQASRLKALKHSTTRCQSLLHNILDFHNTESNMLLASESRESTRNMESMSDEMTEIARKTKTETVSMKIITLVTLFFLPGTFISTLMSTDIFQSEDARHHGPDPYDNMTPLQVYLAASLPLTLVTLAVWGIFHWIERNRERMENVKSLAKRTAHQAGKMFEKQG